jgi:hypothetical protein
LRSQETQNPPLRWVLRPTLCRVIFGLRQKICELYSNPISESSRPEQSVRSIPFARRSQPVRTRQKPAWVESMANDVLRCRELASRSDRHVEDSDRPGWPLTPGERQTNVPFKDKSEVFAGRWSDARFGHLPYSLMAPARVAGRQEKRKRSSP